MDLTGQDNIELVGRHVVFKIGIIREEERAEEM